jgi:uncharacterized protein involved in response to NO
MTRLAVLWREAWRPFFPLSALAGVVFLSLWGHSLSGGAPLSSIEHATAMIWGVFGSAVVGFLLTAFPRQNGAAPPSSRVLSALFAAQLAGLVALGASWMGAPTGVLASVLLLAVFASVLVIAVRVAVPALRKAYDGTTAFAPVAIGAGAVGLAIARFGPDPRLGLRLGVHGFLLLLALVLLDRLLPFFSKSVTPDYTGLRRKGFAPALALALLARAVTDVVWLDVVILAVLLRQWHGWGLRAVLQKPMIAVLHLGLTWIAAGYAAELFGAPGTLPTHLWMLGGMGTLLIGIATRVSLGHGGKPIRLDPVGAGVLALVQVAVVLRAVAPLAFPLSPAWMWIAPAISLSTAFAVWLLRFGPLALGGGDR